MYPSNVTKLALYTRVWLSRNAWLHCPINRSRSRRQLKPETPVFQKQRRQHSRSLSFFITRTFAYSHTSNQSPANDCQGHQDKGHGEGEKTALAVLGAGKRATPVFWTPPAAAQQQHAARTCVLFSAAQFQAAALRAGFREAERERERATVLPR